MAMPASTTTSFAVLVVVFVFAFTVTVIASTSAMVMFNVVDEALHLLFSGIACFKDFTLESQFFSSQRVVEVHLHLLIVHFKDLSEEVVSVFVLQWDDGILKDMLVVEVSVDGEDIAVDVYDVSYVIVTVSLFWHQ